MAFLILLFSLLNLVLAGSQAGRPEEVHWKSVFPNAPMPKSLKQLLPPAGNENPSIDWTKGNYVGAPRFRAYDYRQASTEVDRDEVASKEFKSVDAPVNPFIIYDNAAPKVGPYNYPDSSKESKGVNAPINPFIIYGKGSKGVNAPVNPFIIYGKESEGNKNSLGGNHENAAINETMYFFQEDLHHGKKVKLPLLTKTRDTTTFLPHQVAESIPFSSDKLHEILKYFSFESESREANVMKETIKGCEREVIDGEEMYCATSFESFVDSSVSKLGKNIQLLSNVLRKETKNPVFTIGRGIKTMGEEDIVCHKMRYPYAVFLCHSVERTIAYRVPLVGIDGTKANALAICHKDTSAWNPNHPAFLILKVKPGKVPICHFVVRDTLVWVRR